MRAAEACELTEGLTSSNLALVGVDVWRCSLEGDFTLTALPGA